MKFNFADQNSTISFKFGGSLIINAFGIDLIKLDQENENENVYAVVYTLIVRDSDGLDYPLSFPSGLMGNDVDDLIVTASNIGIEMFMCGCNPNVNVLNQDTTKVIETRSIFDIQGVSTEDDSGIKIIETLY